MVKVEARTIASVMDKTSQNIKKWIFGNQSATHYDNILLPIVSV